MNAHVETPKLFDIEMEQALLGACLNDETVALEAEYLCTPGDFMDPLHGRLWAGIATLRGRGTPATPLTLGAHLSDDKGLSEVGGRAYLVSLCKAASAVPNFKDYARVICDLAHRRRIDAELEAARERIVATDIPLTDCLADVLKAAGVAAEGEARTAGYLPISEAVHEVMREAEDAQNGQAPPSVRTGLADLDALTGGLQAGDMVVVAGRPGQGKTVLLGGVAVAAARAGKPAIVFELEMSRRLILHRIICDVDYDQRKSAHLSYSRMRAGKLWPGEFERMNDASQRIAALPLDIFDTPGMTIHEIGSHAQRFADRSSEMGVVVIDYLQRVQAGDRYAGSKYAEVTEISYEVKGLAKRLGWPVVIGAQLNREVEKRQTPRPQLADLRESGAIEQDADIVIGLHRPAYYVARKRPEGGKTDPGWLAWMGEMEAVRHDMELWLLKNRSGPDGMVKCFVEIGASAIRDGKERDTTDNSGEGLLA